MFGKKLVLQQQRGPKYFICYIAEGAGVMLPVSNSQTELNRRSKSNMWNYVIELCTPPLLINCGL